VLGKVNKNTSLPFLYFQDNLDLYWESLAADAWAEDLYDYIGPGLAYIP
jgi:hypothetical protein